MSVSAVLQAKLNKARENFDYAKQRSGSRVIERKFERVFREYDSRQWAILFAKLDDQAELFELLMEEELNLTQQELRKKEYEIEELKNEDEDDVQIGDTVATTINGRETRAIVQSINEEAQTLEVKRCKGKKIYTVRSEDVFYFIKD